MKSIDIAKKPAYSWVKMKNKVSSFGIGDRSHPQAVQIFEKLGDIKKLIKQAGYVPDTSFALHDTDEEQKEHNLWNHSERLALAFGLIILQKFVSGYIGREIMLRDPWHIGSTISVEVFARVLIIGRAFCE
ncbi:hypothetical protein GIB67_008008 [Kingdonia uniflora]|uniref:DYW domain-containing protein n=1 Tax=Kingdonia uniflora TaxID=39325 RepID=A0A7J7L1T0_9MAGN|nr:hypothetical protein GIB67_008008 [Kingdonia uniflora]